MSVQTPYVPPTYQGDGVATAFNTVFPFQLPTDLIVQTEVVATGVITTLAYGTNYTVTGGGFPATSGTVTLVGPALPAGTDLIILRAVPITQLTHWTPNDPNPSTATENAVDKLTLIYQQNLFNFGRTWFLPPFGIDGQSYFDARGNRGSNLGLPIALSDAVTLGFMTSYIQGLVLTGFAGQPQEWSYTGDGSTTVFNLPGATIPYATGYYAYISGVYQTPTSDYTINVTGVTPTIAFTAAPPNGVPIDIRSLGFAAPITSGIDGSAITSGLINTARLGGGSATHSTILRGDQQWSNTIIGLNGTGNPVASNTAVLTLDNNANAALRVTCGAAAQGQIQYGHANAAATWDMAWTFDPSLQIIGWQAIGGPILGTFAATGDVSFGNAGLYFQRSTTRVGINTNAPQYPLDVNGIVNAQHYLGTADGSLITSGQILPQFLGNNVPTSALVLFGDGVWRVPPSGSGTFSTTTTAPFTIAAVGSNQTVAVTSVTGLVNGTYAYIADGSHSIIIFVVSQAGLNVTAKTVSVLFGSVGDTMASGAIFAQTNAPGQNSIQVGDSSTALTPVNSIIFDAGSVTTLTNIDMQIHSLSGGTAEIQAFTNANLNIGDVHSFGTATIDAAYILKASTQRGGFPIGSGANKVLNYDNTGVNLQFTLLGASNITSGSLTPALLLATNSPSAGQVPSFNAGQYTWVNPGVLPSGGSSGLFLRGDGGTGAFNNVLNNAIGSADNAHQTETALLLAFNDTSVQMARLKQQTSGVNAPGRYWNIDGGLLLGNNYTTLTSLAVIDASPGIEALWTPLIARADNGFRSSFGYWNQVQVINGPPSALGLGNNTNYWIVQNFANNVTITIQDNFAQATSLNYATDMTVEIQAPGAFTIGWASTSGAITWLAGSPPTLNTTGFTVVRFIRRQGQTGWLGYVLPAAGAAYTNANAQDAVGGILANSATIGFTYTAHTSISAAINALSVTGALIANNTIGVGKLSATGTASSSTFLRGDNTWGTPAGGGSGNLYQLRTQGSTFGTPTTYTDLNFNAGFSLSAVGAIATVTPDLTYLQYALGFGAEVPGNVGVIQAGSGVTFTATGPATPGGRTLTISAAGGGGGFSPATSYTFTAPQIFAGTSGGLYSSNSTSNYNGAIGGAASSNVVLNQQISSTGAYGLAIYSTSAYNNPGGTVGMVPFNLSSVVNSGAVTGSCSTATLSLRNNVSSGFAINTTAITESTKLSGGAADAIWFNSWGPCSLYSSLPDNNGNTHAYSAGIVRIGEVNYGNAWADLGYIDTRGSASRYVAGMEFFPDWLGGTRLKSSDAVNLVKYNVNWAVAIGNDPQNLGTNARASGVEPAKHWIGILFDTDAIVPTGIGINFHGGRSSPFATGAAINIQDFHNTGINFAGTAGGVPGGNAATFTSTGNAAITLADDQSIKLGSVWIRGHAGALQFSANGSSWTSITIP